MKQRKKISSNTSLAGFNRVEVVKLSLMNSNRSWELSHQDTYLSAGDLGQGSHLSEDSRGMARAAHIAKI